ncbi:MAG: T9SS type A sorting domain-containing protein [bacterium]|nr:T9SS type A sorting domain-containing protein [bacterium]
MNTKTPIRAVIAWLALILIVSTTGLVAADELEYVDSAQWTFNQDCSVQGNLIVTSMPYGVQIWDASDPAAPVMLSDYHFLNGDKATVVDVMDDLVAAINQAGVLTLLDISNPSSPELVNEISGFGVYNDIVFSQRGESLIAFIAGSTGLKTVNLTDPLNPVILDDLDLASYESSLSVHGDSLVVLARYAGLYTVDATDPASLTLMGSASMSDSSLRNVTTSGDLAVVAARNDGFYVYDIADRTNPYELINVIPDLGGGSLRVQDVMLDGVTLYVTTDQEGVVIYDLGTPAAPVLLGNDPESYYSTVDSHYADGKVFMTHWGDAKDGIHIVDVGDTANPHSLGHTAAWDFTRFAAVQGDIVYTAMGHMGSFAHRFDPVTGFTYEGGHFVLNSWGLDTANDLVYVASAAEGLVIVDWSDPAGAIELGDLNVGVCRAVEVVGDIAYLAVYLEGLLTVDVNDPANPTLLGESGFALQSIAVSIEGNLAATADRNDGMNLWDISDPADIIHVGNFPTTDKTMGVKLHGDIAYVCGSADGLIVVNISNPALPTQVDQFPIMAKGADIEGDLLHVATNGAGVTSFRISDPAHPVETASYNTTGDAQALVVLNDMLFVSDYSGLLALFYDHPPIGIDDQPLLVAGTRLASYPNPFNPVTRISFDLKHAGHYKLEIFDVSGRFVSQLDAKRFEAGHHSLTWQAQDADGRQLPSGVYFARLAGSDAAAVTKLTLVR